MEINQQTGENTEDAQRQFFAHSTTFPTGLKFLWNGRMFHLPLPIDSGSKDRGWTKELVCFWLQAWLDANQFGSPDLPLEWAGYYWCVHYRSPFRYRIAPWFRLGARIRWGTF